MGNSKRTNKYRKCKDITLLLCDEVNTRTLVNAAIYMSEDDKSELIVYKPNENGVSDSIEFAELDSGGIHGLTDPIEQPMTEDPTDPEPRRVYSSIRDLRADEYTTYTCAHGSRGGEGTGVHFAANQSDVEACRRQLGILVYEW